jgi:uncharacterized protein YdcH (DUF465 family)
MAMKSSANMEKGSMEKECQRSDMSDIMDVLRRKNKEYKNLEEQHREYEETLDKLERHRHLTPDQEIAKQEIKKKKLLIKDRMAEITREHLKNLTSPGSAPSFNTLLL